MVSGKPSLVKSKRINSLTSSEFSASVVIGGKKVRVFGVEQSLNSTTGYIESRDGVEFQVYFQDHRLNPEIGVSVSLEIDGESMDIGFMGLPGYSKKFYFKGKYNSSTSRRPFKFSDIQFQKDDDIACEEEKIIENLGTITLVIRRAAINLSDPTIAHVYTTEKSKIINEMSKKATVSHITSLGAETKVNSPIISLQGDFHDIDVPYFVIEFNYRSRDLLEVDGIIPSCITTRTSNRNKRMASCSSSDEEDDPVAKLARLRVENRKLKRDQLEEEKRFMNEVDIKPKLEF